MDEYRPSRTAMMGARARALHLLVDDDPKIFIDTLGGLFCDSVEAQRLRDLGANIFGRRFTQVRAAFVMRHRFAEDRLAEAYRAGIRQYVILGAGLDTFAYRRPATLGEMLVFEVDHPASQRWKRERLEANGIDDPPGLRHVPMDFEKQTLMEQLQSAGFDPSSPAFVSWLGVTFYLTPEANAETFRTLGGRMAPGSELVLDFILPQSALSGTDAEDAAGTAQVAASVGEPFQFLVEPKALQQQLRSAGFERADYVSAAEGNRRYAADRTDGVAMPGYQGLMHARVAERN